MTVPWHTWFAQPWAVWLLALLPPLGLLAALARWQRRRALLRLGGAFSRLAPRRWAGLFQRLCLAFGLLLLIVGVAGPQWGRDTQQQVSAGRDLIVVLDLSRSMLAEQPSRQSARAALLGLADSLQKRGGHRLALVVFAARPKLVLPLSRDYDLFREAVRQQNAARLPAELLPGPEGPPSGTRIGAALQLAVATLDPDCPGPPAILLVSDGDDPADDQEWNEGVVAAVGRHIPVFTVGVGDPDALRPILIDGQPLRFQEKEIESKLQEGLLRQIAERTQGEYVAARRLTLPRDGLYQVIFDRREVPAGRSGDLPRYRQQFGWFFGGAFGLLTLATLVRIRRPEGGR